MNVGREIDPDRAWFGLPWHTPDGDWVQVEYRGEIVIRQWIIQPSLWPRWI